jgi:hypothetical protein
MIYLLIIAAICSLLCILFIASLIIKDTKEIPPSLPAEPYVFKHVDSLKRKTADIPGTEGGHQRVDIIDPQLDLTGLSPRAKKAIVSTGAFKVSDVDMGILGYYLKNTKGVGPKTIAEINAWSEANYSVTIID